MRTNQCQVKGGDIAMTYSTPQLVQVGAAQSIVLGSGHQIEEADPLSFDAELW